MPHLQLRRRQVDIRDHLGARVLHLQTRVQLQEEEVPILVVQVFHRPRVHVANQARQLHRGLRRSRASDGGTDY